MNSILNTSGPLYHPVTKTAVGFSKLITVFSDSCQRVPPQRDAYIFYLKWFFVEL